MLCVRCGCDNPPASKYCSSCQAVLLQQAPSQAGLGGMEIAEGRHYVVPKDRFLSRNLNELHDLLQDWLETGQGAEDLEDHLAQLREAFIEFSERAVPQLQELLLHEEVARPDSEFPGQVRYLVSIGLDLFGQGLRDLELGLEPVDVACLESAFERLQQGNDNLCQSFLLVEERQQQLESA